MLLPLYLFHLEIHIILKKYAIKWTELFNRKNIIKSLFFFSGIVAFGLYCLYQYDNTGFYNAFSIAQKGWEKKLTFPFFSLFSRSGIANIFHSSYTIVAMIFAIFAWRKLPISMNILVWISILLPLSGGSVISMARYISVIFPLFFVLGDMLYKLKKARYIILIALYILHMYSLSGFISNHILCY